MTEEQSSSNIFTVLLIIILAGVAAYMFYQKEQLKNEMDKMIAEKEKKIVALEKSLDKSKSTYNFADIKQGEVKLSVEKVESIPQDLELFRAMPESCVVLEKGECIPFNFINIVDIVNERGRKQTYFIAFYKEDDNTRMYIAPVSFSPKAISEGSSLSMPNVKSFIIPMNLF